MAERIGQLLDLARAGDGIENKAIGVLLKGFHSGFQFLQRAADNAGQHKADHHSSNQNQRGGNQNDTGHLPETFVDGLVNIADADHAPCAVGDFLRGVDDGILHIGAVTQTCQPSGLLLFQPCVEQLLLGVVDHVAAFVHQVAVAVLADAHIVDGGGQS